RRPLTRSSFPYTTLFRSRAVELHVAADGVEGLLLLVHEGAVEPARPTAREDQTRHVERLAVGVTRRRRVPTRHQDRRLDVEADRSEEHTSELQSRENLVC